MTLTLEYATPDPKNQRTTLWKVLFRLIFAFGGVVWPIVCFSFSTFAHAPGPEWQSNQWCDKVAMILWGSVGWPFFPLCLWAIAGMVAAVISPAWAARFAAFRWAVYSGIPLSIFYMAILAIALAQPPNGSVAINALEVAGCVLVGIIGAALVTALIALAWWATFRVRDLRKFLWWGMVSAGVLAIGATVDAVLGHQAIVGLLVVPLAILLLPGAPSLALAAYGVMAFRLWRLAATQHTSHGGAALAAIAWCASGSTAWTLAATLAVKEYAKLPTNPPSCYIATAAARGHPWLVRSRQISFDGILCPINDQLRYCKGFELILSATFPLVHRLLRWTYNFAGPKLAAILYTRLLADATYLLLKPAEWLACLAVHLAGVENDVRQLYANEHTGREP
jgi:hypothetical protein